MGAHARADSPVAEIARTLGASPSQVALAWLLHRSPTTLPIPGTADPEHLAENVAALDLSLSELDYAALTGIRP